MTQRKEDVKDFWGDSGDVMAASGAGEGSRAVWVSARVLKIGNEIRSQRVQRVEQRSRHTSRGGDVGEDELSLSEVGRLFFIVNRPILGFNKKNSVQDRFLDHP